MHAARMPCSHACMQEWEPPQPSRRPDIFPEFEKMERVFLPKPLPGDPEMPDEVSCLAALLYMCAAG